MTGESSREVSHSTSSSMRYSLVESATRAVKWSDAMSFRSGGSQINAAMDKFLEKIVGDIGEIVNPPKVVGVHNGKVIINRGSGSAVAGQTYDIYAVGEALVDPDTGEALGSAEEHVATIKRSEEHTSELQSLMRISYAVFCLKKKHKRENLHQRDKT